MNSRLNTNSATTTITGMVARTRLTTYVNTGPTLCLRSCCLGHVPEERDRAFHDAADVLAPRLIGEEEAGWRKYDTIECRLVETPRGGLFLLEAFCVEPIGHFLLDLRYVRPAEPGAVAAGTDRGID